MPSYRIIFAKTLMDPDKLFSMIASYFVFYFLTSADI